MNIIEQFSHQGDTQWFKIDEVPSSAKKTEKKFIAASERTGSFHALFGDYDMYDIPSGFVIEAKEDCILNHSLAEHLKDSELTLDEAKVLAKKDHRHIIIPKGVYAVGIQQRFDPMSNYALNVLDSLMNLTK